MTPPDEKPPTGDEKPERPRTSLPSIEELLEGARYLVLMIAEHEAQLTGAAHPTLREMMRLRSQHLGTDVHLVEVTELLLKWRNTRRAQALDVRAAAAGDAIADQFRALSRHAKADGAVVHEMILNTLINFFIFLSNEKIVSVFSRVRPDYPRKGDGGVKGRVATVLQKILTNVTTEPRRLESLMAALKERPVKSGAIRAPDLAEAFRDDIELANVGEGHTLHLALRLISPWLDEDAIQRLLLAWQSEIKKQRGWREVDSMHERPQPGDA